MCRTQARTPKTFKRMFPDDVHQRTSNKHEQRIKCTLATCGKLALCEARRK